jgi:hypothetical protein
MPVRGLGLVDPGTLIVTMRDVVEAGADPVEHFCTQGWRERRNPNLYFDTGFYLDRTDVPAAMNPLLHDILTGEALGLPPSRHFDPAWYRRRYAIPEAASPLAHYLRYRRTQRFSPLPSIDVAAYIQAHAKTLRPDRDPCAHFLAIGRFAGAEPDAARKPFQGGPSWPIAPSKFPVPTTRSSLRRIRTALS